MLVWLAVLLGAPSCEDEQSTAAREENEIRVSRQSIIREFEPDEPGEASLNAYENAAIQKLSDFPDFLKMLTDTTLDIAVRKQAGDLIHGMFISVDISVRITDQAVESPVTVSQLVSDGLNRRITLPDFRIDSVFVKEKPRRIGISDYTGILEGRLVFTAEAGSDNNLRSHPVHAEFFLTRSAKVFGPDTLLTWNARLGEIR